jgi:hypothetical protein
MMDIMIGSINPHRFSCRPAYESSPSWKRKDALLLQSPSARAAVKALRACYCLYTEMLPTYAVGRQPTSDNHSHLHANNVKYPLRATAAFIIILYIL